MKKIILITIMFVSISDCIIPAQNSETYRSQCYRTNIDIAKMSQDEFSRLLDNALALINNNDLVQVTDIYKNIRYTQSDDDIYIDRVQHILWLVQPSFETEPTLRKEVMRLAISVTDIDIKPPQWSALIKQLRTFEYILAGYEFQCRRARYPKKGYGSTLQEVPDQELRKKRTDQLLAILQKMISDIDDTWTLESIPMESVDVKVIYLAVGVYAQLEAEFETKDIKNETEREKAILKIREKAAAKYLKIAEDKVKPFREYQHQKFLHDMKDEWEPVVIGLITTFYAMKPDNDEELTELLKKHKMNEKFTQTVFEELKKRMAKSEN
ncbi:MAG: hypothetical protein LBC20_15925 [Planctomycetaceae bacterium]|jgi:hypothetical protein|nr:hypothetical protein [Planctomycetaceae bacterium]